MDEADREKWFEACDEVTQAEKELATETERYWSRDGEQNGEPLTREAWARIDACHTKVAEAMRRRSALLTRLTGEGSA